MPKVELTIEQCGIIGRVLDSVQGMDNARVLLPIYDALKAAVLQDQAALPMQTEARRKGKK